MLPIYKSTKNKTQKNKSKGYNYDYKYDEASIFEQEDDNNDYLQNEDSSIIENKVEEQSPITSENIQNEKITSEKPINPINQASSNIQLSYEDNENVFLNKKRVNVVKLSEVNDYRNVNKKLLDRYVSKEPEDKIENKPMIYDLDEQENYYSTQKIVSDEPEEQEVITDDDDANYDEPNTADNLDDPLIQRIDQIKKLREKKREILHKDEKYDQDYVETVNTSSKDLIHDVYKFIEKNDTFDLKRTDDLSDSEKDLLEWEMEKFKYGMSTNRNIPKLIKKENKSNVKLDDILSGININHNNNLDNIISNIKEDIFNNEIKEESSIMKVEGLESGLQENENKKLIFINKIDNYVNQFVFLRDVYYKMLKDIKKNKELDLESIDDFELYFSS